MEKEKSIKWTLFIKKHWEMEDLLRELLPEYFHRDMKNLKWNQKLPPLPEPAHFQNVFNYYDKNFGLEPTALDNPLKRSALLNLASTYLDFQSSIDDLSPSTLQRNIDQSIPRDQLHSFLNSHIQRQMLDENIPPEANNLSLIIVSLMQLSSASHSLSYLLLFRLIHNDLLLGILSRSKNAGRVDKFRLKVESVAFESSFGLPAFYPFSYDDIFQAHHVLETVYLLLNDYLTKSKDITNQAELNRKSLVQEP